MIARIPLARGTGEKDVDRLASELKWSLRQVIEVSKERPFEKVWITPDGKAEIHYIEDFLLNVPYVGIESDKPEDLEKQIRTRIHTLDRPEIKTLLQSAHTTDDKIEAIYRLAILSPPAFDPELFALFERAMADPDAEARRAAVFGTAYVAWPQFREPLRRLAASDPAGAVKDYARMMLESHEKHGWSQHGNEG